MNSLRFFRILRLASAAFVLLLLITADLARAELVYGVGGTGENPTSASLFTFDTSTPGTLNTIGALSGITAGQTIEGIVFSPTGSLYLLGYNTSNGLGQIYTVNLGSGAATAVNASPIDYGFALGGGSSFSFGLQFVAGSAIQVIDGFGDLFQINSATGAVNAGGSAAMYSPAQTLTPQWVGLSASSGRLYTIDQQNNLLGRIDSTSGGVSNVTPLGSLGLSLRGPATIGFDISIVSGNFYLQTDTEDANVADGFYLVNALNGQTTLIGQIGGDLNFNTIDIALAVPEPATWGLLACGAVLLLVSSRIRGRRA